jgi:hypothetical protein
MTDELEWVVERVEGRLNAHESWPVMTALRSDLRLILSANREMREALEPFAKAADFWEPLFDDAEVMMKQPQFLERWRGLHGRKAAVPQFVVGDLKRARSALTTQRGDGE